MGRFNGAILSDALLKSDRLLVDMLDDVIVPKALEFSPKRAAFS